MISNGAGNYTVWVHRFYRYRNPATELAPTNGAMGYGFPAAIAAKIRNPERQVVCFAGDGCFMMYPQELATAVQFGAPLVVIVVNNGMLGTIRMHQEREYPGRVSATKLTADDTFFEQDDLEPFLCQLPRCAASCDTRTNDDDVGFGW